jgi:hypothetical protein
MPPCLRSPPQAAVGRARRNIREVPTKYLKDALWLTLGFLIVTTSMTTYRTLERCEAFQATSSFCEIVGASN